MGELYLYRPTLQTDRQTDEGRASEVTMRCIISHVALKTTMAGTVTLLHNDSGWNVEIARTTRVVAN